MTIAAPFVLTRRPAPPVIPTGGAVGPGVEESHRERFLDCAHFVRSARNDNGGTIPLALLEMTGGATEAVPPPCALQNRSQTFPSSTSSRCLLATSWAL